MTLFGITFLDDIDLPEFPFPDLGPLDDRDDLPAAAAVPKEAMGERD